MTGTFSGIVIAGLGPGNSDLRTVGVQRALDAADRIVLRTRIHPGLDDLIDDPRVTDCDDLYETAVGFERLYPTIASRVLDAAERGGTVVFAVPGHPRFGERSVALVEDGARDRGIAVMVMDAVSFVDAAVGSLKIDPLRGGLQIVDAEHLAATVDREPYAAGLLGVDPVRPLLVAQVYNSGLAAAVKIALSRLYPDDHRVTQLDAAGIPAEESVQEIALHALDRQRVAHLTSFWVPPLASLDAVRSPESLTRIVARLRGPGGCPWDREQTHATLRDAVLEEAYEVVDAIDAANGAELAEELGDLLLIVAMHAQLAEEDGTFRIEDVYEGITRKLIRRHPHVFGDVTAETPDAVVATWEGVKAEERRAKGDSRPRQNPIDRMPRAMPAARKAMKFFAPRAHLDTPENPEAGDDLLAAIRVLIDRGLDPERALEASLRRFAGETAEGAAPLTVAHADTG